MRLSNYCVSISNAGLGKAAVALRAAAFAFLLGAAWPLAAQTAAPGKTIRTFLLYYGGGPALVASDAAKLAKFDLLDFDASPSNRIGPKPRPPSKPLNQTCRSSSTWIGPVSTTTKN